MNRNRHETIRSVLKFILLIIFVIGIPLLLYFTNKEFLDTFSSVDEFSTYLKSFGKTANMIYLAVQITQVVIAVIPGTILEMCSGYLFGAGIGICYTILGCFIGTVIDYWISRYLGHDFVKLFIKEEDIIKYQNILNSRKGILPCFIIYLIPGLPKDIVNFIAGISGMKFSYFIVTCMIGRLPGLIGSVLMGSTLGSSNYTAFWIITIGATIILILSFIFRKDIQKFIDRSNNKE